MVNIHELLTTKNMAILNSAISKLCKDSNNLKCSLALQSALSETMERLWNTPDISVLEFANANCHIVKMVVQSLEHAVLPQIIDKSVKNTSNRQEVLIGQRIFDIEEMEEERFDEETPLSAFSK
jgi:hypothetical protein